MHLHNFGRTRLQYRPWFIGERLALQRLIGLLLPVVSARLSHGDLISTERGHCAKFPNFRRSASRRPSRYMLLYCTPRVEVNAACLSRCSFGRLSISMHNGVAVHTTSLYPPPPPSPVIWFPWYECPFGVLCLPGTFSGCLQGIRRPGRDRPHRTSTRHPTPDMPIFRVSHCPSPRASSSIPSIPRRRRQGDGFTQSYIRVVT